MKRTVVEFLPAFVRAWTRQPNFHYLMVYSPDRVRARMLLARN